MGTYQTRRNYKVHNFNNSTLTLGGEHKAEGMDGFDVELDEDEVETMSVADGTGLFVENPSLKGTIKIRLLEASTTNAWLSDKRAERSTFSVGFLDSTVPDLECSAQQCRITKMPMVTRGKDPAVVEWVLKTVYLDVKGGSYSLESA